MRRECRGRFPRHWFQRKLQVSDPGMHHGTCVTHVSWCMSGSLTRAGGEKRSRHSRRMRNLQFYISGKRPIAETTIGVPYLKVKSLQLIWRSGTRRWNLRVLDLQMSGGWSLLRADRPDLWLYPQMKQHFFYHYPQYLIIRYMVLLPGIYTGWYMTPPQAVLMGKYWGLFRFL